MIENYIGKTINCSCGKTHTGKVEKIVIKKDVVKNELVQYLTENNFKKITLVCDKKGYEVAGQEVEIVLLENGFTIKTHMFTADALIPDEWAIGNLILGCLPDSDLFLSVGSGVISDVTRQVSAVKNLPFITVGTAPSMDGYISGVSPLIYNGLKLTFETHPPKAVFFDPEVLANAPTDMISAGVGDLLGKISCLNDWKLSKIINDEWHCEFISDIVEKAVEKTLIAKDGIINKDDTAVATLLEALLLSGICMDFAGNSRPASGCEHHMSHFWEMRYIIENRPAIFHGTKVGIGTVISLKAYEYISALKPDFDRLATIDRPSYDEWEKAIRKAFSKASDEIIELEKKAKKNDVEQINNRLITIKNRWLDIKRLANNVIKSEEVKDFLQKLDAPVYPHQIGVDKQMAKEAILYAKEIRNRYTVLQLLYDLGELENFADMVLEEYY